MPADTTAAGLILAVRRNAALGPSNGDAFPTDTDILAWLNEETSNYLVPMLMKPREERFVEHYETETVADVAEYAIPAQSLWEDVRDVQVKWTATNNQWLSLPRIEPEMIPAISNPVTACYPTSYYLRANFVVLAPMPIVGVSLRVKYFNRPAYVVSTGYSAGGGISGPSGGLYTVTVGSTTGMVDGDFDIIDTDTLRTANQSVLATALPGVVASGTTLTFAVAGLTAAQVALLSSAYDQTFIATGDCIVPQISPDLLSLLEQRTTYRALLAKKDKDGADLQRRECATTEAKIVAAMNQRADGLGRHVVDRKFGGATPFWYGVRGR